MKATKNLFQETEQASYLIENTGTGAVNDAGIIAAIIREDKTEEGLNKCRKLLGSVNHDLSQLVRLSIFNFVEMGLSRNQAARIIAAIELGRRRQTSEAAKVAKISSSKDAADMLKPLLSDLQHEEFFAIYLNRANKVIKIQLISKGGVTGTVVDPKIVFKYAIECHACGIILAHNHPSGNTLPSDADKSLTKKIAGAGTMLDIQVLDHLIIAGDNYLSFADDSLM